jgi:hypothetical protein
MINLNKCKKGDILICKHGVIMEYLQPIPKNSIDSQYDHYITYLYIPQTTLSLKYRLYPNGFSFLNLETTVCNDGHVFKKNRSASDTDVIKVVGRQVFKRYLRMLGNKL